MKFVNLEQGSEAWLKWRRGLITASDASSIMGVSPYCTALQCWQRKLALIPEQQKNPAMQRGIDDEPIARAMFNEMAFLEMVPAVIESEERKFLGASLDGICKTRSFGYVGLEIKSQNIGNVKGLGIPSYHYAQLQHQFLSSDGLLDMIYYVSYQAGEIHVIEVIPDPHYMKEYLEKAEDFWKRIVFIEQPDYSEKDYKDMSDNNEWNMLSHDYKYICEEIKILEEKKESYRKRLAGLTEGISCKGNGIKLHFRSVKGRIDYDSIPQLKEVDLELYRKPKTHSYTIFLDAKEKF